MSIFAIVLRNLLYFRGLNLAIIAGVAVATAVVSGALMVGDSVRASLTDLAIQRLGKIDHVLSSPRFFDGSLAERIRADATIKGRFEIGPAVIVRGGASMDVNSARVAGVQIIGAGGDWAPVPSNSAIINSETAAALGVQAAGSDIVFSVPLESDIPRDATLAQRSRQETLSGLRAKVSSIITEPGMLSLFNPRGGQRTPQNAWVNLTELQGAVERRGLVNTLFVHDGAATNDGADQLNAALRRSLRLADYGLEIAPLSNGMEVALTSRSTYLGMIAELTADRVSESGNIPLRRITINLLNAVNRLSEDGNVASTIHYAVAAGISPLGEAALADDEIALNQWTADRLGAKVGDRLSFTFYRRQMDGSLLELSDAARGFPNHFRIAQILPMSGIGADASLTPTYKGLTDADTIASWNPPAEVKIDKKLVTPADEDYWKQYKAAPKLFVSYSTASRLWGTEIGTATSIRMPADRAEEFERRLLSEIDPATMGMVFRPLRQEQIAAASATTDFGQLFIGFSFFLIVAAALLVAMLLRLGVEQRGRQLGAMSAIGFGPSSLRKIMLVEGMALSVCGGLVGSFLAVIYTGLMMAGLRTWWIGAVGTTAMRLYVVPLTLVVGFVIAQIVALLAILWAVRQIGRAAPARLLAGGWEAARIHRIPNGRTNKVVGTIGFIAGLIIIIVGAVGAIGQQAAFLAGGALLLASSLCLLGGLLHPQRRSKMRSLTQLAVRNVTRHNARSVLCIGLIALASFALITVAAMRQGEPSNTGDPHSGAGGYQLIVESEIPLLGNPSKAEGRALLGFREPANAIWNGVEFVPMRRRAGQDVSCLNITQITSPTILGVPQSLIDRGGFTADGSNPWKLLEKTDPSGAIPIIADHSTAAYILHIGVGQTLEVADASGRLHQLRLVATLNGSIFQSELLMNEAHFRAMYPAQSGFGTVLVRVAPADHEQVRRLLSDELNEYAASVRTTASLLASFLEVQNTYLSTFELLGALGLLLGTIGLAVVLVRTVIERKAELALFASLGFSRSKRLRLVLMENGFLLVTGLVLGTACAIVGVLPAIKQSMQQINFTSLALTLVGSLLTGLCASGLAVLLSGIRITPADLRRE